MAELTKWPELEQHQRSHRRRQHDLGSGGDQVPVSTRPDETWGPQLAAACAVDGLDAPQPEGEVTSSVSGEGRRAGEFYCYTPAGRLVEGSTMTLSVHPSDRQGKAARVLWKKDFVLHIEEGRYKLEGALIDGWSQLA